MYLSCVADSSSLLHLLRCCSSFSFQRKIFDVRVNMFFVKKKSLIYLHCCLIVLHRRGLLPAMDVIGDNVIVGVNECFEFFCEHASKVYCWKRNYWLFLHWFQIFYFIGFGFFCLESLISLWVIQVINASFLDLHLMLEITGFSNVYIQEGENGKKLLRFSESWNREILWRLIVAQNKDKTDW